MSNIIFLPLFEKWIYLKFLSPTLFIFDPCGLIIIIRWSKSKNLNTSQKKDRIKRNNKGQTITSLKKKKSRNKDLGDNEDDDDENSKNKLFQTYSNFNDIYLSNLSQKEIENDKNINSDIDLRYFPIEKYLYDRKEGLNSLECELDILLREKNNLENEILKLPVHPKTLKEIKIKRALNDKLSINGKNINNIRTKIRKLKEKEI